MEFEVKKRLSIVPQIIAEGPVKMKIDLDEDAQDCVQENEREAKGGGKFKQYKLFLIDLKNTAWEANFLFQKQLNQVGLQYGSDTKSWANNWVELSATARENGDKTFYDLVITPIGVPQEAEERI